MPFELNENITVGLNYNGEVCFIVSRAGEEQIRIFAKGINTMLNLIPNNPVATMKAMREMFHRDNLSLLDAKNIVDYVLMLRDMAKDLK